VLENRRFPGPVAIPTNGRRSMLDANVAPDQFVDDLIGQSIGFLLPGH
jgi:hypothetical protein